ncbi:MAG: RloB family protein [Paramuribaculum sp.]|nr:RloB family protein [Paramuribaculum sp.]
MRITAPDYPKHTNLKELDAKISESIYEGFRYVFCLIDMDNKNIESELRHYQRLKDKYKNPIVKKKKGIYCEVRFFESHLCTEVFFLYYFKYTTQYFDNQDALLKELNNQCTYNKSTDFFCKCKGLHSYFEKNGGRLDLAIDNADRSLWHRRETGSEYTYSELGQMIGLLNSIYENNE